MVATLRRWMHTVVDIRKGEYATVAWMFAYGFLAITSYYVIKPARNSIFVDRVGADQLPWVYILTAVVVLGVMVLYSKYVDRVGRLTLIFSSMAGLSAFLVGFWWILSRSEDVVSSGGFYVFTKLYPLFLVSQFWLVANLLFTTTQARRLFGFIGVGLILGGIAGSSISGFAAERLGTEPLLLVAVGILGGCAVVVWALSSRIRSGSSDASGRLADNVSGGAVKLLMESSHLKTIAVVLALTVVVGTLLDWQLNRAVELFVDGEDAKTEFFGRFYGTLNVVSVVVQVIFTSFVLRRFGVGAAVLILPVVLGIASAAILFFPLLYVVALGKGAEGALRYSLDQSTRELLFLPVPTDVKYKVKPLIDLAIYRGGTGLGGVLLLVFVNGLGLSIRWISLVTLAAVVTWMVAAWRMRREFAGSLKRLIGVRDVRLEELYMRHMSSETVTELAGTFRSGSDEEIEYALALAHHAPVPALAESLIELLGHESEAIRGRAVALLADLEAEQARDRVMGLLHDQSLMVRVEAIRYLCEVGETSPVEAMESFLEDDSTEVRIGAMGCLIRHGGEEQQQAGMAEVRELAADDDPERRRAAAILLGQLAPPPPGGAELLEKLVRDPEVAVCHDAMRAVGRSGLTELTPLLLDRFDDPQYRQAAAEALSAFRSQIDDRLLDFLEDESRALDARIRIPALLLSDTHQSTVDRLWKALPDLEPGLRYHGLKTLNKLHRNRPDLDFGHIDPSTFVSMELREAARYFVASEERPREDDHTDLFQSLLEQRCREAAERAVRALGLELSQEDLYAAFTALTASRDLDRQRGFELLDALLPQSYRTWFDPLLNPDADEDSRAETVASRFALDRAAWSEELRRMARHEGDAWLSILAHRECGGTGFPDHLTPEKLQSSLLADAGLDCRITIPTVEDEFMDVVEHGEVLKKTKIFRSLRVEDIASIAALTEEVSFDAGDVLFEESAPGKELFVVSKGRVRASKGGRVLFEAGRGESVGSLSLLDGLPTDYQAKAIEDTVALRLEREPFTKLLKDRGQAVMAVIQYLTGVVRGLNENPGAHAEATAGTAAEGAERR